jgi:hypothetical protein
VVRLKLRAGAPPPRADQTDLMALLSGTPARTSVASFLFTGVLASATAGSPTRLTEDPAAPADQAAEAAALVADPAVVVVAPDEAAAEAAPTKGTFLYLTPTKGTFLYLSAV